MIDKFNGIIYLAVFLIHFIGLLIMVLDVFFKHNLF